MTAESKTIRNVGIVLALMVSGAIALAVSGWSDRDGGAAETADLRLPTDDEVCALVGADEVPGQAFRAVPAASSVPAERGGRSAATYDRLADSSLKEGYVPVDASCSWVGDSGVTAGLAVLDYRDRPDLLAVPATDLVVGALVDEHPLLAVEGFDQLAVTDPSSPFATAAAVVGPYVLTAHASFLVDGGQERVADFFEQLFRRWLEQAMSEPSR